MPWTTESTRTAYENSWIRVREDRVTRPDGAPGIYGVVELRWPAVFVVALTDADEVVLVTQHRYTTDTLSIEVPAGASDGEDPLVAAQRELLEETGLRAREWVRVGGMDALIGVAKAPEHVFVARGLSGALDRLVTGGRGAPGRAVQGPSSSQAEEGISRVEAVPFADVLTMISAGTIRDGETIAALALAGLWLGRFA
ncbi:NUDIX hydrolase [Oerskovia turbata]|uniref:NUDIX hydrolase n=1 Tax=Oerskovia turbata TaxID=1713 RepID=A0A4Q1KPS8_9CELL|nr:NUDIX hydrolase [Oerskovia turbata]RXR22053.1 NUDIX hydrolase [Oerskovia turbata]RXR31988.1 NUDIX hydrolase [Oerskovia turbata]TGJ97996.1 NUDIX hydrolase [Actinotalea fermentans ATCC 43279 = JCM 9966 = DSM 3133]